MTDVCIRAETGGDTSAATIRVDGVEVLGPSDFRANALAVESRRSLSEGAHTLSVSAPGRGGESLRVSVATSPASSTAETGDDASGARGLLHVRNLHATPAPFAPQTERRSELTLSLDAESNASAGDRSHRIEYAMRYRFHVLSASSCELIVSLAGESAVVGGTQTLRVRWDGRTADGSLAAPGDYLYYADVEVVRVGPGDHAVTVDEVQTPAEPLEIVAPPLESPVRGATSSLWLDLDRTVYRDSDLIEATLSVISGSLDSVDHPLVLVSTETEDVELVDLRPGGPGEWRTAATLRIDTETGDRRVGDRRLQARPGETLVAIFYPDYAGHPELGGDAPMVVAMGLVAADEGLPAAPRVLSELAGTEDDLGGSAPRVAGPVTLLTVGGLPLQVASKQVIYYPRSQDELDFFLRRTGGTVVEVDPPDGAPGSLPESVLVEVDTSDANVADVPDLQRFFGSTEQLLASADEGLDVVAYTQALALDGFLVALNPRLQLGGLPKWEDGPPCTSVTPSYAPVDCLDQEDLDEIRDDASDPFVRADGTFATCYLDPSIPECRDHREGDAFRVDPEAWMAVEVYDANDRAISVAFLDEGFSPNPDFRRDATGSLLECDLQPTPAECGPGTAVHSPRVSTNLFGSRRWHGNMVVSHAGAVPNNRWGTKGVGGQVMSPMLFAFGLEAYVFRVGTGIRRAVASGASVVNISAGFPCRVQTNLGLDLGICSADDIFASCAFVAAELTLAAQIACETLRGVPIVGGAACVVASLARLAAFGGCMSTAEAFAHLRSPMRSAVDAVTSLGIPVVSIAGNIPGSLPDVLQPFVDVENHDAGEWEIIPCTLTGVICVGAADRTPPHDNTEYFGEVVDIWAPENGQYFGPEDIDDPSSRQVNLGRHRTTGGQTSAATAYTSGTIALLMAANPDLDPRRTSRSDRTAIVSDILALLQDTANPPVAAAPNRGALINPRSAVQSAMNTDGFLTSLSLNWSTDLDLSEVPGDPSDSSATAHELIYIPGPRSQLGTVHQIRSPDGGPITNADVDWFSVRAPSDPGLYQITLNVESPKDRRGVFEVPSLIADGFVLSDSRIDGRGHHVDTFFIPNVLNGALVSFFLRGDNHYLVDLRNILLTVDAPPADRFDFVNAANPPESRPNNNEASRAVVIGERSDGFADLLWATTESSLMVRSSLVLTDLSFSQSQDAAGGFGPDGADDFVVPRRPPHPLYTGDVCLIDTIQVEAGSEVSVDFHTECGGNTVREYLREIREGVVILGTGEPTGPDGCVSIELTPAVPGGLVRSYDLSISYTSPGVRCEDS